MNNRKLCAMNIARHIGVILLSGMVVVYAHAASRTTTVTEIKRGDNVEKRTEVLTIDGDKARLDMYSGKESSDKNAPYLLTVDGGKTWILVNAQDAKSVCTQWNTKTFFSSVGDLIQYAEKFVNAEVSVGGIDVKLDEEGPAILGYKTRHMKIVSIINAKAHFLFWTREYTLEFQDEIWVSPDLKLSPVEQVWVDSLSKSGYRKIDILSQAWNEQVKGTILKQVSVVTMHNVTKNEKKAKTESIAVTKLEKIKSEELPPGTFETPKCVKVTEQQMEKAAKEMLTDIAK